MNKLRTRHVALMFVLISASSALAQGTGGQNGSATTSPTASVPSCEDDTSSAFRWAVEHLPFNVVLGTSNMSQIQELSSARDLGPYENHQARFMWGGIADNDPSMLFGFTNSILTTVKVSGRLPQAWQPALSCVLGNRSSVDIQRIDRALQSFEVLRNRYIPTNGGESRTSTVRIGTTSLYVSTYNGNFWIRLDYVPAGW